MHTESEKHLVLIKQALLEKRTRAEQHRDELMNSDSHLSDLDVINEIIETAEELIDAIDRELPHVKRKAYASHDHSLIDRLDAQFRKIGWSTEKLEYPDDYACALVVRTAISATYLVQRTIIFSFDDLEGNSLRNIEAYINTVPEFKVPDTHA